MNLTRPAALAAAAALLSLVACSSSGGSSPASSSQLKSTLLRSGDLPSEWVAKKHKSSDDKTSDSEKQLNLQLASCIGIPKSAIDEDSKDEADTVHSPDFTLGESTVSSDASPDKGEGGFAQSLATTVLTSSKANSCFERALRKQLAGALPASATIDSADVHVSKPTKDDPANVQFRFNATIKISVVGQSISVVITQVQIADHGASCSVSFEGMGEAVPQDVQTAAVKAVSERVDKI